MKKVRGKALALVLSVALVVSSFSTAFSSAASRSEKAADITSGAIDDLFLVNGGSENTLSVTGIGTSATLTTKKHAEVDAELVALSHSSGSSLVKWNDFEEDGSLELTLRSSSVKPGTETLKALYKGTYQDADDNDITVTYTDSFDVTVFDNNSVVIGVAGGVAAGNDARLDATFAQKTLANELSGDPDDLDSKDLTVYQARLGADNAEVNWAALKTAAKGTTPPADTDEVFYTLKSSSTKNIGLTQTVTKAGIPPTYSLVETVAAAGEPGIALSDDGKTITFSKSASDTSVGVIYTYGDSSVADPNADSTTFEEWNDEGKAVVTLTTPLNDADVIKAATYTEAEGTKTLGTVVTSSAVSLTPAVAPETGDTVTATVGENAGTGSVTFTAEITDYGKASTTDYSDEDYPDAKAPSDQGDIKAKTSVTKTILVNTNNTAEAGYVKFGKYRGYNYLYKTSLDSDVNKVKITGYEVRFVSTDKNDEVEVADNASVDTISGSVKSVDVTDGTVNTIDIGTGDVTVTGEDAKANSITTAGTVDVSGKATAGDIDGDTVTVSGSKAGNITAVTAYVKAEDEESATTVGNITAALVDIESVDSKGVTVGTITSNAPDATVNVSGNDIKLGGFDFDYYNTTLTVDDFQGTVPAPVNADIEGSQIVTSNADDAIEITGDLDIDTITLADESKVTLDGKATVLTIEGAGTLVINAGDLSGLASVSGTTLKLADPNIKPDEKVFTAISDSVDVDDFVPYGFTLKKTAGSSVDTFYVDQPEFRGLEINKASSSIANGYTETFTASAYPTGTPFPAGYVGIQWSIDNEDKFELTKNDNGSVTVKAINYDPDFVSENKGTLKAELIDEDGEVADEDEYAPGEATLTVIEKPLTTYKSDTTGNVALGLGQTYQFKITSLDGKPVTFAVASNGATVTLANASGNDYYYKVTGAKVGNYGVYVNADKTPVAVLNITSNVKIDTTTVTIASGKTYQFKVTAPAQPTFQVAGLGTIALAQKTGNDYFYKVTANNVKGGHGVYVNGARLAIATFA